MIYGIWQLAGCEKIRFRTDLNTKGLELATALDICERQKSNAVLVDFISLCVNTSKSELELPFPIDSPTSVSSETVSTSP
jgi:hypothetical protein